MRTISLRTGTTEPPSTRLRTTIVTVTDRSGSPLPSTPVTVSQTRHAFAFGNIGFDFVPPTTDAALESSERDLLTELGELYTAVFNTATLPFYWGDFEPRRGQPHTERLMTAARWFAERGVAVKGHPLVWHSVQPPWLLDLGIDEIEAQLRARIRREVTDFRGVIDSWDAINEVVIMPVFDNGANGITPLARARGRIPMIRMAFDEARAANPSATLLLNDFDLSSAYECLIEGVLEAGIRIDAIGLQTHMHQGYWGEEVMLAMVDRFARYGIPLHLTETSLVSGDLMPPHIRDLNDYEVDSWPSTPEGEARQADEVERHYRSLVAHPAVEAITYWGLTDRGAWLGAPIGLVRADGSPKPSYDALKALVAEEWRLAPTTAITDGDGRLRIEGFAGEYLIAVDGASRSVTLDGTASVTVAF